MFLIQNTHIHSNNCEPCLAGDGPDGIKPSTKEIWASSQEHCEAFYPPIIYPRAEEDMR